MISRREFLQYSAYLAVAIQTGIAKTSALASMPVKKVEGIKGKIIATAFNLNQGNPFPNDIYNTVLSSLDLETGGFAQIPIKIEKAHDCIKVEDNFLVIPNKHISQMHVTDLSGRGKDVFTRDDLGLKGHGFYDKENNVIIASAASFEDDLKGYFVLLDPKDFKMIDAIELNGNAPHDFQLYDEDTFAVCNYNIDGLKGSRKKGYGKPPIGGYSELALYDRKTLELKERIPAYKNALISHSVVTDNGDLYAIGFDEYDDPNIANWDVELIEDRFQSYYAENHPELAAQWPDIAKSVKIHSREKLQTSFGLPLLPMKMAAGTTDLNFMQFDDFHHRRAQSICYVKQTNTVCFSYPNSDSVHLYNATTHQSRHIKGDELRLKEMRGICEIEGTAYLAISGTMRGITIIDTADFSVINHYDLVMGSVTHMHHIV